MPPMIFAITLLYQIKSIACGFSVISSSGVSDGN